MKPLFLCSLSVLLVLLLGCGTKFIDVNISVTDPNDKPLHAKGTLKDRIQRHTLNFDNGIAPASIAKPKKGEEIFLDISCPGYKPEKDVYAVEEEGQTIRIKLEPLRPRIEITNYWVRPTRLKPTETCDVKITIANTGEGVAQAVTIKYTLPKDFEYVTGSINSSSSKLTGPEITDDSLTWSLESLPPSENVKISYRLRVNSNPEEGERSLELLVSSTDLATRPVPDRESVSFLYVEPGKPDLSIQKTIEPEEIKSNVTEVECTIALENSGNGKAINLTLEDSWPKGFAYKEGSFTFASDKSVEEIIIDEPTGSAPYVWRINVLPASTRITLTYTATIDHETIGAGVQSTALSVKATDEQGGAIKKSYSASIIVEDVVKIVDIDVPNPESKNYAPNPSIGTNPSVGVNRPADSGEEEVKEKEK